MFNLHTRRTLPAILALVTCAVLCTGWTSPAKPPAQPAKPAPTQATQPASPATATPPAAAKPTQTENPSYVLGFKMNRIDGTPEDLSNYKGKVLVIVNVASKCGLTPQYEALQKLYQDKKDKGLVILGFPANNFGGQEPGTNSDIQQFCKEKYEVTFPLFEKISVKGEDQHALYKKLAAQPAPIGGEPKWNFTKFIVGRDGNVVARFEPRAKPDDAEFLKQIDELLARKD